MLAMEPAAFNSLYAATMDVLGPRFASPEAKAMLWAIGRQESRMIYRRQIGGPARGLWQFERGGGVRGVLTHHASRDHATRLCYERGAEPTSHSVYATLELDDILACGFARLLLFTEPRALPKPEYGNAEKAWSYYLRAWRPGKPHRHTWDEFWNESVQGAK